MNRITLTITLALALLISTSVRSADAALPPDKTVDVHGGTFDDVGGLACADCHEDAVQASFEGASMADLHHFLYGEIIPNSTKAPYGTAGELYVCLSCHAAETKSGTIEFIVERDCRVCHQPPPSVETIIVDIKPGSDRNPINPNARGVLPVLISGSRDLDVTEIDVSSLLLEGTVAPLRWSFEKETDGYRDLALEFSNQAVCNALGDLQPGQTYEVEITGMLEDGTKISGSDSVYVVPPARKKRSKR